MIMTLHQISDQTFTINDEVLNLSFFELHFLLNDSVVNFFLVLG